MSAYTSSLPTTILNVFWRIKNSYFLDTEEVRYDIPSSLPSGVIYIGIAPNGSATSSTVWNVVKTTLDANGNPSRDEFRSGISWDDRAIGW